MGFPIGVLIGVSLAGYFLGAFNSHHSNRSNATVCRLGSRSLWQRG
jgi:hypothetical protein